MNRTEILRLVAVAAATPGAHAVSIITRGSVSTVERFTTDDVDYALDRVEPSYVNDPDGSPRLISIELIKGGLGAAIDPPPAAPNTTNSLGAIS